MANPNSCKRNWWSNIFSPLSTADSKVSSIHLPRSLISAKTLVANEFSSGSFDIKTNCFEQQEKNLKPKFVSLERLDSVGNSVSEPSHSYPPGKTNPYINDYIMGNQFKKAWVNEGPPEAGKMDLEVSEFHPSAHTDISDSTDSKLTKVGSFVYSSLRNLTGKLSNSFGTISSVTPLIRPKQNGLHREFQGFSILQTENCVANTQSSSDGAYTISQCMSTQVSPSCETCDASNCQKVNFLSGYEIHENHPYSNSDLSQNKMKNCTELNCDTQNTVNESDSNSDVFKLQLSHDLGTFCKKEVSSPIVCKNPFVANILDYESDSETEDLSNSYCENNDLGHNSYDDSFPHHEHWEENSNCGSAFSYTSDIEDTDSDESTSEEEMCPWDRILLSRASWIKNHRKKSVRRIRHKSSSFSDSDSVGNCGGAGKYKCKLIKQECDDFVIESSPSDNRVYDTVKRPTCSNSTISYIIGVEKDEDEFDEDDEFSWSDSENVSCEMSSMEPMPANETALDNCTSQSSTSCHLWNYFVKRHSTFMDVCSSELNKPMLSNTNIPTSHSTSNEQKTSDSCSVRLDGASRKAPSKVRFNDDVTVHPMVAWGFAYRQARKGNWERFSRDQCRFKKRISEVESEIGWCFLPKHRENILKSYIFQRTAASD